MASSLSNIVSDLAEGIQMNDKKYENFGIKYIDYDCFLEYTNFEDNLIEYKCLCCNKNYQKKFDENLKKNFFNTYKFSNHDINMFNLLLHKGIYPYKHMDNWEKFSETLLPKKKIFAII